MIGHSRVLTQFERQIEQDNLAHAFLFMGPNHVGKTTFAKALAKELLETTDQLDAQIDYVSVARAGEGEEKKTMVSVDQIRELRSRMSMSSFSGGYKVVFIEDASFLSPAASNALLKILEEPRGKTVFILRAEHREDLLDTIVSRCQIFRFYPVSNNEIENGLVQRGLSKPDAALLSKQSHGRPGVAIRLLKDQEYRSAFELEQVFAQRFFSQELSGQLSELAHRFSKRSRDHAQLTLLFDRFESHLRDMLLDSIGVEDWVCDPKVQGEKDARSIVSALDQLYDSKEKILHHVQVLLALEQVAIRFAQR